MVIPAGCLSIDRTKWNPSHPAFFLPVRKLSIAFRDRLFFYLIKENRAGTFIMPSQINNLDEILQKVKQIPWVVNSQAPVKGKNKPEFIIRYLSRYVAKTVVTEQRISKIENGYVYLNYFNRKKKKPQTEVITEELFLKRLAFHILPKGFKKIRFYGFLANRCRANMLTLCRMLLGIPLSCLEDSKESLNDTAFLFWKYFGVDISLCPVCGKGHIYFVRNYSGGG